MTSVSGIFFSVSNGDSTALCSLSFDTNLRKIDYAEVIIMRLIMMTMMEMMLIMMMD